MSVSRSGKWDLGPIMEFANEGLPSDLLEELGKAMAASQGRRIKLGAGGVTFDGERLDPNSESWVREKQRRGGSVEPLVFRGLMTEPTAWEVSTEDQGVTLTLKATHQRKWDTIIEIAEKTGNNWKRAWGFGDMEDSAVLHLIGRWLTGLEFEIEETDVNNSDALDIINSAGV